MLIAWQVQDLQALIEFLTKCQAFKTTWQVHPTHSANRLVAPFKDGVIVQNVASEWLVKMGKVGFIEFIFIMVCCYDLWYSLFYNLLYCLGCLSFFVMIYVIVFYKVLLPCLWY